MTWAELDTDAKAAVIRPLIETDVLSYAAVALRTGASRVAVAGVAHRHGIKSPNASGLNLVHKAQRQARKDRARTAAGKEPKKPKNATRFHKFVAMPDMPGATEDRPVKADAWAALPGSTPVPLWEHTDGCRWPVSDPALCCNLPVDGESRYCPAHHRMGTRDTPVKAKGVKVIGIAR